MMLRLPLGRLVLVVLAAMPTQLILPREMQAEDKKKAEEATAEPTEVDFDHAKENESRSYIRSIAPGQIIQVNITNTCVEQFSYDLRRIRREAPPIPPAEIERNECPTTEKSIDIVHEEQYGGYIISIKRTSAGPIKVLVGEKTVTLSDVDLVISVPPRRWDYELAGAFTTSWLTDPAFAVETRIPEGSTDGVEKTFVVRDRKAEDDFRLGVAAFVHVFHTQHPHLAATFGIGVNEGSQTTYFTGLSFRFGDAAALTIGRAWGSVKRLPPGTRSDRPVDAGILGNLGSRTDSDWFFALSYKFLKPSAGLQKPFDKVQDPSPGSGQVREDGAEASKTPSASAESSISAPTDLKVAAACTGDKPEVQMSWKPEATAKGYEVVRATKAECESGDLLKVTLVTSAAVISTKDLEVTPNIDYWYAVRSIDQNSRSGKLTGCKKVSVKDCAGPG